MAKLNQELIAEIEANVSLVRMMETVGIALVPDDQGLTCTCPFHTDSPCLVRVDSVANRWSCNHAQGGAIDFVMTWNGISFSQTVELLRHNPSFSGFSAHPLKISRVPTLPCPVTMEAEDYEATCQSINFYHETLKDNSEGLSHLERHGLVNSEMIDRFCLGFSNRTLGFRLPQSRTKPGDALRQKLQRIGILRDSGHEHFRGCLVIPIRDENGVIVQVYGRRIGQDVRAERAALALHLPGPIHWLWNVDALQTNKEILLCDDPIDALTFWCAGFRNVVSFCGPDGLTPDHLETFKRHGTEKILIAIADTDTSSAVIQSMAQTFLNNGIDCYQLHFPKDVSVNEFARCASSAETSLGVSIRSATWLGKGIAPTKEEDAVMIEDVDQADVDVMQEAHYEDPMSPTNPGIAPSEEVSNTEIAVSPVTPPRIETTAEVNGDTIVIMLGDRRYRIRGLNQNLSINQMKVNVMVSREESFHVDMLELHSHRQRAAFAAQAAKELNQKETVIQRDLGKVFLKLEELQEKCIAQALAPKSKAAQMTEADESAAIELLRDPKLLDRVLQDLKVCGIVGEEINKLIGYLAAISRKLDKPLAVIIQSTSAAGKSSLMDAVLDFVPDEDRLQYSAITGQALYYVGQDALKNKVLALAEEEGAKRAAYALKLLLSEGRLAIASTGKRPENGELIARDYAVEGPTAIFMTTTQIDLDEELLNRCLVLAVDEEREQTQAIHQRQREAETLDGLIAKEERQHLLKLHRNAQRLLRPLPVVNPYATQLTFPDQATRARRDHMKYLVLIRTIALLHQHQREIKTSTHRGERTEYIEVAVQDIDIANRLAHEVLGRTLDELPPQTRRLLFLLDRMARERCQSPALARRDYRFSRRDVRDYTGWGDTQLKVHLKRLVDFEYVLAHRGGRGQSFVFELLYDGQGQDGKPFLQSIIDVDKLHDHACDMQQSGQHLERSVSGRAAVGGLSVMGSIDECPVLPAISVETDAHFSENTSPVKEYTPTVHTHDGVSSRVSP